MELFLQVSWLLLVTLTNLVQPQTPNTTYFIGFPASFSQYASYELIIGTTTDRSINFSVESLDGLLSTTVTSPGHPSLITIPNSHAVQSSAYADRHKGILIHTEEINSLFVHVVASDSLYGTRNYIAYPYIDFKQASYEYFTVSVPSTASILFNGQIILVSGDDGNTIKITPSQDVQLPTDAQNSSSGSLLVKAGETHQVILNRLQTLLVLFEGDHDLTGTKIRSQAPLTVVSGHQCALVPVSIHICGQLAVQVPPTITWGHQFLFSPFAGRSSGQLYKIVAALNDTNLAYKCSDSLSMTTHNISKAGEAFVIKTLSSEYCHLYSEKNILVVQLSTGSDITTGGDGKGKPDMAIVAPFAGYVNKVVFVIPSADFLMPFLLNFISIVSPVDSFEAGSITLDGTTLQCEWITVFDISGEVVGYGCTTSVSGGIHTLQKTLSDDMMFSALAYSFHNSSSDAFVYLTKLGLENKKIDECVLGNGGCEHLCTNTEGSFVCSCQPGYSLHQNGLSCPDTDECAVDNGGCEGACTNTLGSSVCSCGPGYILNGDGLTCDDINECAVDNGGCEDDCTNTLGSFVCIHEPTAYTSTVENVTTAGSTTQTSVKNNVLLISIPSAAGCLVVIALLLIVGVVLLLGLRRKATGRIALQQNAVYGIHSSAPDDPTHHIYDTVVTVQTAEDIPMKQNAGYGVIAA